VEMMTGTTDGYSNHFKDVSARELAGFLRDRAEARTTIRNFFAEMDEDDSGYLDKAELAQMIGRLALRTSDTEMDRLFEYMDNGTKENHAADGKIQIGEFCEKLVRASESDLDSALGPVAVDRLSFEDQKVKGDTMHEKVWKLRERLALDPKTVAQLCKADSNSDGIIDRSEFILWCAKQSAVYNDSHHAEAAAALFDALDKAHRGSLDVRHMVEAIQRGIARPSSTVQAMSASAQLRTDVALSPMGKASLEYLVQHPTGRESSEPSKGRYTPFARRSHDNNTKQVVIPDENSQQFCSEADRFTPSRMKPMGRGQGGLTEALPQEEDAALKLFHTTGKHKNIMSARDRIAEYAGKLDSEAENAFKARINGKTHQKFKYLKAIAKYETIPNRMAAKNLGFLENAKALTKKIAARGPLSDPTASPSPIAWVYDGIPTAMYEKNKDVIEPSGVLSKDVWKWH